MPISIITRTLFLFGLFATQSFGVITFITSGSGSHGGTASPGASATVDSSTGDLIVVEASFDSSGTVTSISDSGHVNAGCYTLAKSQFGTASSKLVTYYCVNPVSVGTGHTITINGTSLYSSIFVSVYKGAKLITPVALTSGASYTGTTIQPGNLTPGCTNELMVTGITGGSGVVVSAVAGATLRQTIAGLGGAYHGGGIADSIQTAAAAFNPTWTITSAPEALAATSVAFLAADSVCGAAVTARHRIFNK